MKKAFIRLQGLTYTASSGSDCEDWDIGVVGGYVM